MTGAHLRLVVDAERVLRSARAALDLWHGGGEPAWPIRRAAAERALARLDEAARAVDAAREVLVSEIEVETDRRLAADGTVCAAGWGVCPERGNTLPASGGRTWCRRRGCGREWAGGRVGSHCDETAAAVISDQGGGTMRLCVGHWIDTQERLVERASSACCEHQSVQMDYCLRLAPPIRGARSATAVQRRCHTPRPMRWRTPEGRVVLVGGRRAAGRGPCGGPGAGSGRRRAKRVRRR